MVLLFNAIVLLCKHQIESDLFNVVSQLNQYLKKRNKEKQIKRFYGPKVVCRRNGV